MREYTAHQHYCVYFWLWRMLHRQLFGQNPHKGSTDNRERNFFEMSQKNIRSGQPLDEIDKQLVRLLRADARTPNSKLAELVDIAPSTCMSRVRSLVSRGVISAFSATVNPAALGLGLQALISVNIRSGARAHISEFNDDIRQLHEVMQVFFLGGSEDFIIHIAVHDTDELREFVLENLSAHPAVASTRTSVVFQHQYNGPAIDD